MEDGAGLVSETLRAVPAVRRRMI